MTEYQTLLIEKEDLIGTIVLNRPDRLNAFNATMRAEFPRAMQELGNDPEVRVIVITGAGDAYSAGADIHDFSAAIESGGRGREGEGPAPEVAINAMPTFMTEMGKVIIASINGVCVGMGLTLSLCADIRMASDKARFGAVFVRMGIIPEYGSTYMLSRVVGIAKACELVLTARIIDAAEAKEIGLVNHVVPAERLREATREMAAGIAKLPPFAMAVAKRGLYQGLNNDIRTQMQYESMGLDACFRSADHAEAVKAFLEKREPKFR
ncbi:MAG: enoyl-CoA hydratase/isomerase family protein [Chloroflexota bacterium]